MELRAYQAEVLDEIRVHRSTVAFMPTGSGKTLVAVRLLSERVAEQRRREANGEVFKACIFTAPNKVLCHQQAKYIENNIGLPDPKILVLTGEVKGTAEWQEEEWKRALQEASVVVCVPEILRRALESGFVKGDWIDTLIFDECHHCVSKNGINSGHAYCHLAQLAKAAEKFVGLTASPLNCKKVDVDENMKQLKKVLALGGDCEIVRPTVNMEEMNKFVFAPPLELKTFGPSKYLPNCKRFLQNCDSNSDHVHKLVCRAYHRVSWMEECRSLLRSIRVLGKDAPDFGMSPIAVGTDTRDLPLHILSYYCEMIGQMGKILHECGTRTAAYALSFICRSGGGVIDDLTVTDAYNKAKTKVNIERLQRRIDRLEEFRRVTDEPDLFDKPIVDAVRRSLLDLCSAICEDAGLSSLLEDSTKGESLADLERWIQRNLMPKLIEDGGDSDKLLQLGELLHLTEETDGRIDYNAAIVFVGERLMARSMAATLGCPYCVGGRDETASDQAGSIETFKDMAETNGEKAVLVATSVCDEGVDVPACDRVILWDIPPNVRCYIQRRGRARSTNPPARLFLMVSEEDEDALKAKATIADFECKESEMARLVDFWVQSDDNVTESDDSGITPAIVVGKDGVRIPCRRAKAVLHEFCSSLRATDEFYSPEPWIYTESAGEPTCFRAVVVLPSSVNPPSVRWAMSDWQNSETRAVREACARQLEKLAPLPWVTAHFRNSYLSEMDAIADNNKNDELADDVVELARSKVSLRSKVQLPPFKKPNADVRILYAYALVADWDVHSTEAKCDLTGRRVAAVNKLMLLTSAPLDQSVVGAIGQIPISATGLGRSDTTMGKVKISLGPSGQHDAAIGVDSSLMDILWDFHKEMFSRTSEAGFCSTWRDCDEQHDFWMLVPGNGVDRAGFDAVLDAFKSDIRLLLDFIIHLRELCRMVHMYRLSNLPPLNPRALFEALTPKQCQGVIDSDRYESLGSSVVQLLASELVWSKQFESGNAALEGRLTSERQLMVSRDFTARKAIEAGLLDLIQWRYQRQEPPPGCNTSTIVDGSHTKETLVAFSNAARSCMLALIGAICDSAGVGIAAQAITTFGLLSRVPSEALIPHTSFAVIDVVSDWQLPADFPSHVRERLSSPPVTYDKLAVTEPDWQVEIGGYLFTKHPWLLSEALTHASVTAVSASYSNERLEWLGDAVLGAIVHRWLFQLSEPPGKLVQAFSDHTCNAKLAKVAVEKLAVPKRLNSFSAPLQRAIGRFTRELSSGRANVRRGPKPLADCVEAILGAIWLDAGGLHGDGWSAAWKFVTDNIVSSNECTQPRRDMVVNHSSPLSSGSGAPLLLKPTMPVDGSGISTGASPHRLDSRKRPATTDPDRGTKVIKRASSNVREDLRGKISDLTNSLNADQLRDVVDYLESLNAPSDQPSR